MENRNYLILLYDYYQDLLSEKQQEYFEDYYFNNLSLGEISDNINISRNAIHKVIKNTEEKILFYEDKLNLYDKSCKLKNILTKIEDEEIKKELEELI